MLSSMHHQAVVSLAFLALAFCGFSPAAEPLSMPSFVRSQPLVSGLGAPTAVASDVRGQVYVVESGKNRLSVFFEGRVVGEISQLHRPISVAVDREQQIYVGNADTGSVDVYGEDLRFIRKLGAGDGAFLHPAGIAVRENGTVYVADSKKNEVHVFDAEGAFQFAIGSPGSNAGEFTFPVSLALDESADRLFVTDLQLVPTFEHGLSGGEGVQQGARIQVFGLDGTFQSAFAPHGRGEGRLVRPLGVAVDPAGRLYVSDAYQNVVQVYSSAGASLGALYDLASPFQTPLGIAFGKAGNTLFVVSQNAGLVETFDLFFTGEGEGEGEVGEETGNTLGCMASQDRGSFVGAMADLTLLIIALAVLGWKAKPGRTPSAS